MDRELLLLYTMAAFTGVAAVALVLMLGMMFATYRAISALRERSMQFLDRWEPVADDAKRTLTETREQSAKILADVKTLTESGQQQMQNVAEMLAEFRAGTSDQLQRVDDTLRTTLQRVDETTAALQQTFLVPVRQARGVAAAVDAVFRTLGGRRRPSVDRATQDEEMFI